MHSTRRARGVHHALPPRAENVQLYRLHLTCEAVQKAETLRDVFLKKLDDIYNARQSLNLEAVKALLPEDAGASDYSPTALPGARHPCASVDPAADTESRLCGKEQAAS